MQPVRLGLGLAAPLVLLGAATAAAQPPVPPPEVDPSRSNEAVQTRELEREIEQYPGGDDPGRGDPGRGDPGRDNSNDPRSNDDAADTRIPEQIQPAPEKPAATPRPHAASPLSPTRAPAGLRSAIDPSEVQRVFGSDATLISLASLDAASITRLQLRLQERGHYRGPVDGVVGPQTRAALRSYARAQFDLKQRLLKRDQLTTDLAEPLGVEPGAASPDRPAPSDDAAPATGGDTPLPPPEGAAPPPPGMTPLPTPSRSPSSTPASPGDAAPPPSP